MDTQQRPCYTIDKTFEFCYGHRVWSQQLNGEYSDDLKCACRHLHGHEGKVQVYMTSQVLENGMVTDFRHLEFAKKIFNTYVDHQFILDVHDPLYRVLTQYDRYGDIPLKAVTIEGGQGTFKIGDMLDLTGLELLHEDREMLEGLFIVPWVPTSENLARWTASWVQWKLVPLGVSVSQVDWWETPKSRSSYRV